MKLILATTFLIANIGFAVAATPTHNHWTTTPKTEHGGGCRKSSPPGECCHAGSEPLHCHVKP